MTLVDTHCHINTIVKNTFDKPLTNEQINAAQNIIDEAKAHDVTTIINVGTSIIESLNCIALAQCYAACFASVGIHPNDCTSEWSRDIQELKNIASRHEEFKIVAIGECGIDKHYPDYNLQRQKDAFMAQIELSLVHNLALIVHTRDAGDETLRCLDDFRTEPLRGVIHCFSENMSFAQDAISMGFVLGFGGTITYPKNQALRDIAKAVALEHIILETDAPFLPPQIIRGKQNHPKYIRYIAEFLADLKESDLETVANLTTGNARRIFHLMNRQGGL